MNTTRADLVVVGAGLAGSAAAWAAAERGLDVVVLEAFGPGHRNGSSHGSARIFRRAYLDPLYVRLTGQAGTAWRQLEAEAGEPLLTVTGGVDWGPVREPQRMHALLTDCGVAAELLPAAEAAERWPQFDFTGTGPVMFHPEAGVLDPDRAMAAMLRLAAAHGAAVHFTTPVTKLTVAPDGIGARAHTDSGTFIAPVIVLAAGPWLPDLAGALLPLPKLTVTQQQIFHLAPRQPPAEPWPAFIYQDETDSFYGLPGGQDGEVPGAIKLGEHHLGPVTTPATRDFTVDPTTRDQFLRSALRRLPGLAPTPINEMTCLYTSTPTEDFILDRRGPWVIASPCSGHGAKFAPLVGGIIAALAAGAPSPDPRFTLAAHLAT